jgi:hypothetical protein
MTDFEIDPPLEITVINPLADTSNPGWRPHDWHAIRLRSNSRSRELHIKAVELTHIPRACQKKFCNFAEMRARQQSSKLSSLSVRATSVLKKASRLVIRWEAPFSLTSTVSLSA